MTFESEAVSSQGAHIEIETGAGTPLTATAVTAAAPPVVTVASHTLNHGDVVAASGIGAGPTDFENVNGRDWPVKKVSGTTFQLVGADSTGETPATDGTLTPKTFTALCEAKTFQGFDGQAGEIDVTTLCSDAKEYRLGLQDFGSFSFDMNVVPDDVAQLELEEAKADGTPRWFKLSIPDGAGGYKGSYVFKAYVRQKSIAGGVDAAITSQVSLRITGEPVFVAYVA